MKWQEIKWWLFDRLWPSVKCFFVGHSWHSKSWQHIDYKECPRCGAVIPYVAQPNEHHDIR